MADVTIVYWRDIPAQVIVGKGRRGTKVQLSERFEQAIDRAAMKVGAKDADAYLAEWRKATPFSVDGADADVAILELREGEFEFLDNYEGVRVGSERSFPSVSILTGKVLYSFGNSGNN